MNKNTLIPAAIASTVVGALMLTGCSEANDEFKDRCKKAGGTIERENDFDALGMGPVALTVPRPPAPPAKPAPKAEAPKKLPSMPKAPKVEKLPKNDAPKSDKTKAPGSVVTQTPNAKGSTLGKGKGKGKSGGSSDDNGFLCVKDGDILFEEAE